MLIQDVLHYYLGSKFMFTSPEGEYIVAKLENVNTWRDLYGSDATGNAVDKDGYYEIMDYTKGKLQLILLHPNDMTKEQMSEYKNLCFKITDLKDDKKIIRYADTPDSMHYLFKNGIDAFDLIENELAIDIKSPIINKILC